MDVHELFNQLLSYGSVPEKLLSKQFAEELKLFTAPLLYITVYTKDQLILSPGQRADYIYFLDKGFAYGYHTDAETQNEIVHFIWGKHSVITDSESFFQRKPSHLFINVTSGTVLTGINYADLIECFRRYPVTEVFARNVALQYKVYAQKRSFDIIHVSAWNRYLQLVDSYPGVEQSLSQKVIASYLGITPQSLSRLRKRRRR